MSYIPEYPPNEPKALSEWLYRELSRISSEMDKRHDLEVLYTEPSRLHEGMIRYADGTNWNPGSGAGPYCYNGSSWVYLG